MNSNPIYVPSTGATDWQWLLAQPGKHWKHGQSAMSLADAWERDGWPPAVASALNTAAGLGDLELLLGMPEYETPLPGGRRASQTDVLVLGRTPNGENVVIAVEGKADEPFGDDTVSGWRGTAGKEQRLAFLLDLLNLPDDATTGATRYQLLHRTAAAAIEARRFGAKHAVMLVHSFRNVPPLFDDYALFGQLFGASLTPNTVTPVADLDGVTLYLGWVDDEPQPLVDQPLVGTRFDRAVSMARELHTAQRRKGTQIPYLAHLLGVVSLVLEDGGDEDEAIAAVLHDAVEDQGGPETLRKIQLTFGSRVASIVSACSDTDEVPKPPWRARKEAYLAHLRDPELPAGALRVSLADKVHNARSIRFDLLSGEPVFDRFSAPREETLWYYDSLASAFEELKPGPLADELRRVVDSLMASP